jgi:hypothetical protein
MRSPIQTVLATLLAVAGSLGPAVQVAGAAVPNVPIKRPAAAATDATSTDAAIAPELRGRLSLAFAYEGDLTSGGQPVNGTR